MRLRARGQLLHLVGDGGNWSIKDDVAKMLAVCRLVGIDARSTNSPSMLGPNYFLNRFSFLRGQSRFSRRALINYFHGLPGSDPKFEAWLASLIARKSRLAGVRVSTRLMFNVLAEEGFEDLLRLIPIEVDSKKFSPATPDQKAAVRARLGIPQSAVVLGSFQKDGEGWGGGENPKFEKGPDILVDALGLIYQRIPELLVVISGPSRGYVRERLTERGIPHKYLGFRDSEELPDLYRSLDGYIVPSRDEGGPKGALESMCSGIPLVTTPVGQVNDFEIDGSAVFKSGGFHGEEIAELTIRALNQATPKSLVKSRELAEKYNVENYMDSWRDFLSLSVRPIE